MAAKDLDIKILGNKYIFLKRPDFMRHLFPRFSPTPIPFNSPHPAESLLCILNRFSPQQCLP